MKTYLVWAAAAVVLWLLLRNQETNEAVSVYELNMALPRGIRNNNPLNIKLTNIGWDGKIPKARNSDGVFEQFESAFYGIRAGARDLWTKYSRGQETIRAIITQFAPSSENNTEAYIQSVSQYVGVGPDNWLSIHHFPALIKAMIGHENGAQWRDYYSDDLIYEAIKSATGYDLKPYSVGGAS